MDLSDNPMTTATHTTKNDDTMIRDTNGAKADDGIMIAIAKAIGLQAMNEVEAGVVLVHHFMERHQVEPLYWKDYQ